MFFGDMNCGRGDMLLVVEEQDSTYPPFNPPLLFISKAHDMLCLHKKTFQKVDTKIR